MGRLHKILLSLLLALSASLLAVSLVAADQITIPSADRLSQGDWMYDAMAKLAADGLVPGCSARVFQGDRRFNRLEMAELVREMVKSPASKELHGAQVTLIDKLVTEFRPELLVDDPNIVDDWHSKSNLMLRNRVFFMGEVLGSSAANPNGSADSNVALSGFAALSHNVFAMTTIADQRPTFFLENTSSRVPDKGFIQGYSSLMDWSVGREYMNWGPAYLGSLVVSDNSSPFIQLHSATQIDFGWLLGKVKITQFGTSYTEYGKRLYMMGRRYEKPIWGGRWHAAINEVVETNKSPNPAMLVMPFYLYQQFNRDTFDAEGNVICSADLLYQARNGNQMYGEYAIDDISAPKLIFPNRYRRPRKTAATLGFYTPKFLRGKHLSTFRAEYTYVDPQTYEATRSYAPELNYMQDGELIGHPIGPNSEAIYLRSEQYLSNKFSLIGEFLDQHKKNASSTVVSEERHYVSLMGAYDITPGRSVALRVAPYRIVPIDGPAVNSVLYEARVTLAF